MVVHVVVHMVVHVVVHVVQCFIHLTIAILLGFAGLSTSGKE